MELLLVIAVVITVPSMMETFPMGAKEVFEDGLRLRNVCCERAKSKACGQQSKHIWLCTDNDDEISTCFDRMKEMNVRDSSANDSERRSQAA
ncbi:hypothetical protein BKA81DRAFT_350845 [Phyllosticta paracitricarpa]|uniref:Uncharacterized protein n=1 Tax=Phyllosticta citricarpa TaxID=55181 RepID=A0ABR1MN92_9PEZI